MTTPPDQLPSKRCRELETAIHVAIDHLDKGQEATAYSLLTDVLNAAHPSGEGETWTIYVCENCNHPRTAQGSDSTQHWRPDLDSMTQTYCGDWVPVQAVPASLLAKAREERDEARVKLNEAGYGHDGQTLNDAVELALHVLAGNKRDIDNHSAICQELERKRAECESALGLAESAHESALSEATRLRGALREIHAYLRLDESQDHTRHGEACGVDACILCLAESVARSALSTPSGEEG